MVINCICVWMWEHRYGVVLRKLDLLKEAVDVFVEAIHALPLHWGAWLELSNLVTNIEMVTTFVFTYTQIVDSNPYNTALRLLNYTICLRTNRIQNKNVHIFNQCKEIYLRL